MRKLKTKRGTERFRTECNSRCVFDSLEGSGTSTVREPNSSARSDKANLAPSQRMSLSSNFTISLKKWIQSSWFGAQETNELASRARVAFQTCGACDMQRNSGGPTLDGEERIPSSRHTRLQLCMSAPCCRVSRPRDSCERPGHQKHADINRHILDSVPVTQQSRLQGTHTTVVTHSSEPSSEIHSDYQLNPQK